MKNLLFVLLAGCVTTSDVERRIGQGSSCVKASGEDSSFLCTTKSGKHYVCTAESGGGKILCFEAVDARDLE